MVALLVLSVGMIGIAALHGQSLSASRTAIYRTQAISLVGDLSDRIRVNRGAQLAYEGAPADNDCDQPTGGGGVDCSPAEMAAHDLFVWQSQVAAALPGGRGSVDVDASTAPATYRLSVAWDDPGSADPVSFGIEFRLPVY
jgi:type IV pilus assembly protein PilV